jgi:hypothetical protein
MPAPAPPSLRHHDAEQLVRLQGGEGLGREACPGVDIVGMPRGRLDTHRARRGEPVAHGRVFLHADLGQRLGDRVDAGEGPPPQEPVGSSTSNASSSDSIRFTVAWELSPAAIKVGVVRQAVDIGCRKSVPLKTARRGLERTRRCSSGATISQFRVRRSVIQLYRNMMKY